mmetsp:Transcript_12708/g.9230  ORF Transcript_12708/g.9230 Transcript_12708/m.9230 type:complete len:183 (-) Transcript_12708:582-1130(-)|eukprot:CAMPEP_0202962698 /NCGR_PEP_ID=MMETSP1396-20130829/6787_1 /ASSEMBLY_ACC=CAM_ASM_000872 /TAXON_ID= /ORGANISM="Pseudokeronopsis sp., Strain Brazil" /LENGTH=182 /DNA_ID=CAMNT_0049683447 /DNA_START=526 /DNA_END=1074 /DNA_ORIENTATION=+
MLNVRSVPQQPYLFLDPRNQEDIVILTIQMVEGFESSPNLLFYVYIDDVFAFHSRPYHEKQGPDRLEGVIPVELSIDLNVDVTSRSIRIDVYDTEAENQSELVQHSKLDDELKLNNNDLSNVQSDGYKEMYNFFGAVQITIDDIFRGIILRGGEGYECIKQIQEEIETKTGELNSDHFGEDD